MRLAVKTLAVIIFIGLLAGLMGQNSPTTVPARAEAFTPTEPTTSRKLVVPVEFTWYDWWMARWENNEVLCRILVEHEGQPSVAEIRQACGTLLANEWSATQPCNLGEITTCRGMYLHFVRSFPGKRDVDIFLPPPTVWISLTDCNPTPTINRCTKMPSLLLTGEEKLPNEQIIRIQGNYAGHAFSCPGDTCVIPLGPTGSQGTTLEFWADSSFGDSSEHFQALVRVTPVGDFMAPEGEVTSSGQQWYVDVLSPQWHDGNLASCSEIWQVFPDVGGPPAWLNTPVTLSDMLSTRSYYYLAGRLITTGEVDASTCPDGGLISGQDQVANQCGLERALPKVIAWQNQFDTEILKVSKNTGIPAQLIKNIFGRESQFWPGLYSDINEAGLGQMTEKGADTVLLWNPSFYQKFCPLILSDDTCQKGFVFLKPDQQNLLRGGLVGQVNAACPDCPLGIDLTQAEFSVNVFAKSLLANCSQTGRVVSNVTGKMPGLVSSYVDLWKFTLVNYNAGPGCLWEAMSASQQAGERITWENVSARLDPVCQAAISYVDAISGGQPTTATPTAWVFAGTALPPPIFPTAPQYTPTPIPTGTPTLIISITPGGPTATRTPTLNATLFGATPTATQSGYPGQATPGPTATQGGYPGQPTITLGPTTTPGYPAGGGEPTSTPGYP